MPTVLGQNFIAGARSALGEPQHKSLDATTGEALPYSFYQATDAEIDAAALAAKDAFPAYRQLSPARRAEFLEAIADELDALGDDFVAIVCQETA
ncbi:MAG TPA: aldehyde dehydrogenase family protein, partial [Pseudomonas sp.]|uniref:aldehyde dehydrogenase family protein n=1 Tax=Pseudomonas sp. TaxID=306 RepID=UPI002ED7C149